MTNLTNRPETSPDTSDGRVADATKMNWVDRFAPRALRPFLRLSRADRPAGTWLLLIPCYWGLALSVGAGGVGFAWADLWMALGFTAGAFLMRGAGCTWNDFTDRHIDAQVARTRSRPLPSGQVSPRTALLWIALQVALSALILLQFNPFSIVLGIAALIPVVIYPFAKRFTWWPQVFLGVAFNWGALLGWAAHSASLSPAPLLLYAAGMVWTLFYDTIYAHQDKEDDALIGVKSTARLFGAATLRWLVAFQIIAVLLMAGAVILAFAAAPPAILVLALAAPWGFGLHMFWQLRRLDINDPANCLRLFRANRDTGLIAAALLVIAAAL